MRMRMALLTVALLAGCGKPQNMTAAEPRALQAFDVAEPAPPGIVPSGSMQATAPIGPQLAYTYTLGYRLADGAIGPVQAGHVAQCTALGSARCRIISSNLSSNGEPGGTAHGQAVFLIDARLARAFIARLDAATDRAGGTQSDRTVEAEDVTTQIIDTDARVRAKQALADRLVGLIKSTNAKVGDLVAAEQAYADTQEALDAARSNQAELRQRVAMSRVTVDTSSTAAAGAWAAVAQSVDSVGATLAASVAALVTFVVGALPWGLLLAGLIWGARRRGWRLRWPWRRRNDPPPA